MDYGLYSIFLGMRARQNTLETQANNIANASTSGFKAERLLYSSVETGSRGASEGKKEALITGVSTSSRSDFSSGAMERTGRSLDVAIEGRAFLQVQTPRGVRFTRAGSLSVNGDGQLTTRTGDLVVGVNGPITVPQSGEIAIGADGSMSVDGKEFDQLKLVRFVNPAAALAKEGDSVFLLTGIEVPQKDETSTVVQGSLEQSNVDPIAEMVAMISNNREFESLQKSLTLLMNDLGKKVSNEIGRLS